MHLNYNKSSLLREILIFFRTGLADAKFVKEMCVLFCFRNLKCWFFGVSISRNKRNGPRKSRDGM